VYLEQAGAIAINELAFIGTLLSAQPVEIRKTDIGRVPYILFETAQVLSADDIRRLSRLSFAYAIFEKRGDLLAPIGKDCGYFIDEDISAILKYSGKTNELFTRLMINLALAHTHVSANNSAQKGQPAAPQSTHDTQSTIKLLDPMAGKGTTLYEGLMQGLDVYGVEIDPKPVYEAFVYIKKHFEMARYKHTSHTEKTGGIDAAGKKFTATRYQVQMARSKEEKKGDARTFEILAGDTRNTAAFFKKNFFHAIVADLPYGVHHGAKKSPKEAGLTRNALGLIKEALPGWLKVLKPGGVVVLAWNLFLIDRVDMVALFTQHGLTVPESPGATGTIAGLDFSHRLDQATHRDLICGVYTGKQNA